MLNIIVLFMSSYRSGLPLCVVNLFKLNVSLYVALSSNSSQFGHVHFRAEAQTLKVGMLL